MLASVQRNTCPFCGLGTDAPHETQEACIEALHTEIVRMRGLLDAVKPVSEESAEKSEERSEGTGGAEGC
jgi:hypothetical protein